MNFFLCIYIQMQKLQYFIFSFSQKKGSQLALLISILSYDYFFNSHVLIPRISLIQILILCTILFQPLLPHDFTWISSKKTRFKELDLKFVSFYSLHILSFGKGHHYLPNQNFQASSHPRPISFPCYPYLNCQCVLQILHFV